MGGLISY